MKVINKNIRKPPLSNLLRLMGAFCILFITTSLFGSNFNNSIFKSESVSISSTDSNSHHSTKFQDSGAHSKSNLPFDFELTEETESTDENSDEDASENEILSNFLAIFQKICSENSFETFNISFQKRIQIPLFLLYNSLKIPTI